MFANDEFLRIAPRKTSGPTAQILTIVVPKPRQTSGTTATNLRIWLQQHYKVFDRDKPQDRLRRVSSICGGRDTYDEESSTAVNRDKSHDSPLNAHPERTKTRQEHKKTKKTTHHHLQSPNSGPLPFKSGSLTLA
jgi:hypothetical protein